MGTFFSFPGMAPTQSSDTRGRLRLPDIHEERYHAQLGEFLESRKGGTSHLEVGLNRGDKIGFIDATGERRPAIVEGEERDSHSGKVDVYLRANDPNGSGSYKVTFEGDTARSMKSSRVKRIHE